MRETERNQCRIKFKPAVKHAVAFGALLGVALIFRCINLGRAELWQDEMIFVNILSTHTESAWTTFTRYWSYLISMGQMPLAGTLQNIYIGALESLGMSDAVQRAGVMRLPMVLFGTVAVGGVFCAARRLLEPGAAWVAGLLIAVTFYPIYYSREAYCYAHVLFFSSWGLAAWIRLYQKGDLKSFVFAVICFTGLGLSALGAQVVLVAWSIVAGIFWACSWFGTKNRKSVRSSFAAALAPGLAFLFCSPYLFHFLKNNTAHIGAKTDQSFFLIINDGLNRIFLGENVVLSFLAWMVFGLGAFEMIKGEKRQQYRGRSLFVGAALLSMLLLAYASYRTQYISARYFSPVVPLLLIVYGQGLWAFGKIAARALKLSSKGSVRLCQTLIVCLFLFSHIVFFLPRYWSLRSKDEPFGWVAEWLNSNLAPGSLYQLESAYQYRFLGGYHQTPNLIPLAPYVQGGSPDELRKLQQIQEDVCLRFPEAVFITLGHPGWNDLDNPWKWPSQHFRQCVTLRNDALHQLADTGILPKEPYKEIEDHSYCFNIYFNTLEDRKILANKGGGVIFEFPGWHLQSQRTSPVQILYFRSTQGNRAEIELLNVSGIELRGHLILKVAGPGAPGSEMRFNLLLNKQSIYESQTPVGKFFNIKTDRIILPPGRHSLEMVRESTSLSNGLLLWDISWIRDIEDKE